MVAGLENIDFKDRKVQLAAGGVGLLAVVAIAMNKGGRKTSEKEAEVVTPTGIDAYDGTKSRPGVPGWVGDGPSTPTTPTVPTTPTAPVVPTTPTRPTRPTIPGLPSIPKPPTTTPKPPVTTTPTTPATPTGPVVKPPQINGIGNPNVPTREQVDQYAQIRKDMGLTHSTTVVSAGPGGVKATNVVRAPRTGAAGAGAQFLNGPAAREVMATSAETAPTIGQRRTYSGARGIFGFGSRGGISPVAQPVTGSAIVGEGETLASVAHRVYGSTDGWQRLAALNGVERVHLGQRLRT